MAAAQRPDLPRPAHYAPRVRGFNIRSVLNTRTIGAGLTVVGLFVLAIGWLGRGDAPSFDIGAIITALGLGTYALALRHGRPDPNETDQRARLKGRDLDAGL